MNGFFTQPVFATIFAIAIRERSVGTILREKGFEVVPQVGVAGFFIDLAVKHASKDGSYLLGIECDGASYHSGRSAHDRDRLSEEILINLGWNIHQIWSTDWFKSRATEIERLLKHIEEILVSDPDYRKEQTKQARAEFLRRALLDLRDDRHGVPGLAPSKGPPARRITGRVRVPATKVARRLVWTVSQQLRTGNESKQIARYLPRVLQAIIDTSS